MHPSHTPHVSVNPEITSEPAPFFKRIRDRAQKLLNPTTSALRVALTATIPLLETGCMAYYHVGENRELIQPPEENSGIESKPIDILTCKEKGIAYNRYDKASCDEDLRPGDKKAPLLSAVHGALGDRYTWVRLASRLNQQNDPDIIPFSLPGHEESDPLPTSIKANPVSMAEKSKKFVAQFVEGNPEANFICHSTGGAICAELLNDFPLAKAFMINPVMVLKRKAVLNPARWTPILALNFASHMTRAGFVVSKKNKEGQENEKSRKGPSLWELGLKKYESIARESNICFEVHDEEGNLTTPDPCENRPTERLTRGLKKDPRASRELANSVRVEGEIKEYVGRVKDSFERNQKRIITVVNLDDALLDAEATLDEVIENYPEMRVIVILDDKMSGAQKILEKIKENESRMRAVITPLKGGHEIMSTQPELIAKIIREELKRVKKQSKKPKSIPAPGQTPSQEAVPTQIIPPLARTQS